MDNQKQKSKLPAKRPIKKRQKTFNQKGFLLKFLL